MHANDFLTLPVIFLCAFLLASNSPAREIHVSVKGNDSYDGSPLTIDIDYFGKPRDPKHPGTGPFAEPQLFKDPIKVW